MGPFVMSDLWICGITPPPAIVALISVSSSSSPEEKLAEHAPLIAAATDHPTEKWEMNLTTNRKL